jgi:hypothetical protein
MSLEMKRNLEEEELSEKTMEGNPNGDSKDEKPNDDNPGILQPVSTEYIVNNDTGISNKVTTKKPVVLAIDVERLGQSPTKYSTIEIGASVVGSYPQLMELDRYSHSEYRSAPCFASEFIFEEKCQNEFWNKHKDILQAIEKDTDMDCTVDKSRTEMIAGLCQFVEQWRQQCERTHTPFYLTMDNKICDAWTLNTLIETYMPEDHPVLPFSFDTDGDSKYQKIYETKSIMLGILLAKAAVSKSDIGKTSIDKIIRETYNIPKYPKEHSHRACDDAYVTACDFQVCLAIADGTITGK